jgi:hypothetical protein
MDFQANRSDEEDRVMQRQLYRPGQSNQPAAKTPPVPTSGPFKPSSPPPAKAKSAPKSRTDKTAPGDRLLLMILLLGVGYYLLYGTPSQRKKTLVGIGVAVWLLMLGGISYCLFLPDLDDIRQERRAIFMDKSLSFEEKREKVREMESNLTPGQRKQMREMDFKEMTRKRNKDMYDFLKMTPEEQVAYLKKRDAEWQKRREEFRKMFGDKGPGSKGGGKGNGNNKGNGGNNNGGPGGGGGGGGPPGGGWGGGFGGGGGGNAAQAARLDSSSPESRAGGMYQRSLMQQMGLGGGGRGGPPGGR